MLSAATVLEVRRLLQESQLSQRAIAEILGVSRGTVANIAMGRRGVYGPGGRQRNHVSVERGPTVRCRGCGGMVFAPCRLCQVRAFRQREAELKRLIAAMPSDRKPPHRAA